MRAPWSGLGWPIQAVLLLMRGIVPFMIMMPVLLIGYVLAIVAGVVAVAATGTGLSILAPFFGGAAHFQVGQYVLGALVFAVIVFICSLPLLFAGGLMSAVASLAERGNCSIWQVFDGFNGSFWPIIRLMLLGCVPMTAAVYGLTIMTRAGMHPSDWPVVLMMMLTLAGVFALWIVPLPLMVLHGIPPLRAVLMSLMAVAKNILPVLCHTVGMLLLLGAFNLFFGTQMSSLKTGAILPLYGNILFWLMFWLVLMVLAFAVPLTGYVFYRNVFTDSPLEGGSRLGLGVLLALAACAGTVYWRQAFGPSENRTSLQTAIGDNIQPAELQSRVQDNESPIFAVQALTDYADLLSNDKTIQSKEAAELISEMRSYKTDFARRLAADKRLPQNDAVLTDQKSYLRLLTEILVAKENTALFVRGENKLWAYGDETVVLEWPENDNAAAGRSAYMSVLYRNGKPFQAVQQISLKENPQIAGYGICVFQPDGKLWKGHYHTAGNRKKTNIKQYCHQIYSNIIHTRATLEQRVRAIRTLSDAESESIASFKFISSYVEYKNLPELMPKGMTENSLTVGYDASGQVRNVFWSFGKNGTSYSQNYYLKNGKVYLAKADTYLPAPKGSNQDDYHVEQKWAFNLQGNPVNWKPEQSDPMPDYPLNRETMMRDIERFIRVAATGGAERKYKK